jgi:hypothetical protein
MPMRGELPTTMLVADQGDRFPVKDVFAVGIFTVIGLVVALGLAIAFPISLNVALELGG